MKKIVTFGEIMLRLQPPGFKRFEQTTSFDAVYGGGEANVSVSLANFGMDACFVSKLPDNPLGQAAVNELRKFGVDVSNIVRGGERIGIYFAEKGASQRPSKVVYDRNHSAIMGSLPEEYDWKNIFADVDWFHFTGITPALGQSCAAAALERFVAGRPAGEARRATVRVDFERARLMARACVVWRAPHASAGRDWVPRPQRRARSRVPSVRSVCVAAREGAATG